MCYSAIVMVNLNLKNRTCKCDPYKAAKSRIDNYVSVDIGDILLNLFYGFVGKNTCRCTHYNNQPISARGLLLLDVLH